MSETDDEGRLQRIRETAYDLWEKAGRPDGQDHAFWLEAEKIVDGEIVDQESEESFPASDPPSFNP